MSESEAFVDVVHLASSLTDPKSQQSAGERLKSALPAALDAIGHAPFEQIVEYVRSARAAGMRFKGSDEDVARALAARSALIDPSE